MFQIKLIPKYFILIDYTKIKSINFEQQGKSIISLYLKHKNCKFMAIHVPNFKMKYD